MQHDGDNRDEIEAFRGIWDLKFKGERAGFEKEERLVMVMVAATMGTPLMPTPWKKKKKGARGLMWQLQRTLTFI